MSIWWSSNASCIPSFITTNELSLPGNDPCLLLNHSFNNDSKAKINDVGHKSLVSCFESFNHFEWNTYVYSKPAGCVRILGLQRLLQFIRTVLTFSSLHCLLFTFWYFVGFNFHNPKCCVNTSEGHRLGELLSDKKSNQLQLPFQRVIKQKHI